MSSRKSRKLRNLQQPRPGGNASVLPLSPMEQVFQLEEQAHKMEIQRELLLSKAISSSDINQIYKARKYLANIEQAQEMNNKALLVDPNAGNGYQGYREKPYSMSYELLRKMSKLHVVNAIIKTRKQQIAVFAQPQQDKYSTGFIIKKKQLPGKKEEVKMTTAEERSADYITQFILDCGNGHNRWHNTTFESFLRLIMEDSLTLDQACFEIPRDRLGRVQSFIAVDGATFRMADYSKFSQAEIERKQIQGYLPSYVQLFQGVPVNEFYPWELCFGIRNPTTDIARTGYGCSELEDLMKIITSILNADHYNANFFKVGSNNRGILRYSGNINTDSLNEFREQWNAQVSGVNNMHKMPIINADKLDWINTHESNRDMEYSSYYEFLIKLCSAVFCIDPSEFGFHFNGGKDSPLFEAGNDYKIRFSKDKGLKPLLSIAQFWLNKYIVSQIDPNMELNFVGLDENTADNDLKRDIDEVQNIKTLNEVRGKRNLPPLPFGDFPLNAIYAQQVTLKTTQDFQQKQTKQQQSFVKEQSQSIMGPQQPMAEKEPSKENPFIKSFNDYLLTLA